MWLWVLLTSLTITNIIWAAPEVLGREYTEDTPDDALFLYMDERSFNPQRKSQEKDVPRIRSALDKNFMRFGRSDNYYQKHFFDDDDSEVLSRSERGRNDNFIRYGRGRNNDLAEGSWMNVRYARDPYTSYPRGTIRFGRSVPLKRSRRDVYSTENMDQYKRGSNRDMLRFGRRDNFLRFGRFPLGNDKDETHDKNQTNDKNSQAFTNLVELLTSLALQMQKDGIQRNG